MLRTASTQGERTDERKQIKITRADSQDTWASELSKEAVGANKVLCWSPDAFVRCQKLLQAHEFFDQRFEPVCRGFSHMVDVHPPDFFLCSLA